MKQKKMFWSVAFILLVLISTSMNASSMIQSQQDHVLEPAAFDRTFIAGTIIQSQDINGTVTAKALNVMYMEQGILVDTIGFVRAFSDIQFTPKRFFYTYTPGPFGLINYVIGFCSDFEIVE